MSSSALITDTPKSDREKPEPRRVLVSSVSSDSHTWNLVYLQLVLEELGHEVRNIGACVPDDLLLEECLAHRPALVVIS
ncbi:cobalamin-dependent protein, partial [Streptomyces sp. NPDC054863]